MYVELQYFIALIDILPELETIREGSIKNNILKIWSDFNKEDYLIIKKHEEILQHDIKALEYFIRDKFIEINLKILFKRIFYLDHGLELLETFNLSPLL